MEQPRVIGHVVSVHGFRLKVELSTEAKSPSRATPDGVHRAVAINSFLTFDLGAGVHAIGIMSDLEARESYDPTRDDELTLELTKPRRTAFVQLLGTIKQSINQQWEFDSGITILPTLDTPAEVASPDVLSGIFTYPPLRNLPQDSSDEPSDSTLEIGHLTGNEDSNIHASFNDLFSRPLAIVGNTGSGKSYTVASLLRGIIEHPSLEIKASEPHIFILDINGEYANAFLEESIAQYERLPNKIYLNGKEFCLPAWLMNGEEICNWLQASEATQEPILKDWWAIAKADTTGIEFYNPLQIALHKIENALHHLDDNNFASGNNFIQEISVAKQYTTGIDYIDWGSVKPKKSKELKGQYYKIANDKEMRDILLNFKTSIIADISENQNKAVNFAKTADSPRLVPLHKFRDPNLVDRLTDLDSSKRIDQYLMTLKLRLRTRLDDRRWQSFFSFEAQSITSFEKWMSRLGIGEKSGNRVSVLDLSMLASETLPFACAIIGRLLLESREMLKPNVRSKYPWLLVLEEAHNYIRPRRIDEERSISLSRNAFERVAKEGRKFGLSLVVASQRPSEISPTIISQCANFFSHRLQNPDDIEHFRRIIPKQAQRLLDQVTVLTAGEAIVFGSAVHVPSRVQIKEPSKKPWSSTSSPFSDWRKKGSSFPLNQVLGSWGLTDSEQ